MKQKKENIQEEIRRYNPDLISGLSKEQVEKRIEQKQINEIKDESSKSYKQIILGNIFTFFNILMLSIAAVLIIFVGLQTITNLSFLMIATINTVIGTAQECKSKKAINKLKLLNQTTVGVLRDGKRIEIPINQIVLDDIIEIKPGDQVPVDCIIMEDEKIEVNESLLTGESRAVKKNFNDVLYAGSFIISGSTYAKADKIANNTYIHSLEAKAKDFKKPKSKLMISINRIIKTLAGVAIPLAIIVFINEIISLGISNYKNAIFYGVLVIPYMVPVGMMLLSSISMASGVINLSKKNVLAQDLYSVEALSRIDTICLDKTGTLTDGTMTVEKTIILGQGDVEGIVTSYINAFKSHNQTSKAILNKFNGCPEYPVKQIFNFSSERKYSGVEFENGDLYVLGAPEYLTNDEEILEKSKNYAEHGLRVVLLVKVLGGKILEDSIKMPRKKEFVMFVIRDNIRKEIPDAMKWFGENDVDIKVISGDNAGTVSYIAKHSGIKNWDKVVDMSKITENDNFEKLVMENSIFARVLPEQKAEIIDILKKNKRTVGCCGDGINDIIALKKADCSIALANGSQATKNVSNLVLLDSNFANMKEAVFEGRRVVNNVQRSSALFVMKDFLWIRSLITRKLSQQCFAGNTSWSN